jgi:serine/threonine protein kinase
MESFGCRAVTCFEKLDRIGEGTYGTVYRARDKETNLIVALKKLRMKKEKGGFPLTSIREIKILKSIDHPNIVSLLEVSVGRKPDSIFLVFEYCEHDFAGLLDRLARPFTEAETKTIMLQLLSAVEHLHSRFIIHRDLKLSNLLLNKQGLLKLADFGLCCPLCSLPSALYALLSALTFFPLLFSLFFPLASHVRPAHPRSLCSHMITSPWTQV